jgi:hypothetical protein
MTRYPCYSVHFLPLFDSFGLPGWGANLIVQGHAAQEDPTRKEAAITRNRAGWHVVPENCHFLTGLLFTMTSPKEVPGSSSTYPERGENVP